MPETAGRRPERRDVATREALIRRVESEFHEMPCLCLTGPQAQRLFALRSDVAERVLSQMIDAGALSYGVDGRYRLRAPAQSGLAVPGTRHSCPC